MRPRLVPLALVVVLAGCVRLHVPAPPIRDYRLDYASPQVDATALPVILRVAPFAVAAIYDREPIVYREGPYATGTYYDSRWSAGPGNMIADLLARDFSDSGVFRAVQGAPSLLAPDYQLGGDIEEIEEQTTASGCQAHLRMRVIVTRVRLSNADPVLLRQAYGGDQPCACNQPHELVAAMSQVMATISAQLQRDVDAAIAADIPVSKKD